MGRSRSLLAALAVLLLAPASALAGPCIDVTTGPAASVTATTATLTGSLDPHGQLMTYRFELGPTITYASSTVTRSSTVTTPTTVSEKLAALTPGTLYHYRLVGTTPCGTEYGADGVFATPLAPGAVPLPVLPIVYTSWATGNAEVDIVGSDGNGARNLSNSPATDFDGVLSPDGARVAFASTRTGHGDLYVIGQDGTGLVRVTNSPYADTAPAWSPDGRQLVFVSSGPAGPGLFIVNADGTGRRRLTTEKAGAGSPAWSPNGQSIAFTRTVKGTAAEIYTIPATGGTALRLTHNTVADIDPAWSPDSTHLAWTRTLPTGASSLIVAIANDTGETTVTAASELARQAHWLDGTRLAYVGLGGGRPALTIVVLGGGPTLRLFPLTP